MWRLSIHSDYYYLIIVGLLLKINTKCIIVFFHIHPSPSAHYGDSFRTSSCVLWTCAKCACAKENKSLLLLPLLTLQRCVLSLADIQKTRRTLILPCVFVEVIRLFAMEKKLHTVHVMHCTYTMYSYRSIMYLYPVSNVNHCFFSSSFFRRW
jgi:hypothetical protein